MFNLATYVLAKQNTIIFYDIKICIYTCFKCIVASTVIYVYQNYIHAIYVTCIRRVYTGMVSKDCFGNVICN